MIIEGLALAGLWIMPIPPLPEPLPTPDEVQAAFPCEEDEVLGYVPGPKGIDCLHVEEVWESVEESRREMEEWLASQE